MIYSRNSYSSLPAKAGVYRFLDADNTVLYVGKANDLKARVSSYFSTKDLGDKTRVLVSQIQKINITIVESELEALLLEAFYIKKFTPKYNIRLTDNKSYLRIKITLKEKYPSITLARREEDRNAIFFGPYPSSSALRLVLKTFRRIFPFVSVPHHLKRVCLYHHLNLCPCPPVFDSPSLQKQYKKNIRQIIRMLEGESQKIMREFERDRDRFAKNEQFEDAMLTQKKIDALSLITTPFHRPFEYALNPNLREDIRQKELVGLMDVLNTHYPDKIKNKFVTNLNRIECYDISNTQGTNPTASMVVLTRGEIDKSQYRKFKMRTRGPNDFAMMQEVLTRRLKHLEWEYPGLLIVDGGKGQVSSALKILKDLNLSIPLIGLAKREETIIIPVLHPVIARSEATRQSLQNKIPDLSFIEVSLPKNSPSLHLIMRIRDEAHRFAITYHKKLRSRSALASSPR